ncbi:MAG: tetraacyldisaccharide 4'-kinase [Gemmatimonadetes bacterium]|nr:tetraacyldisaccharide 4'-kinase [Gemmatimonadota bacterium]MYB60606.1 tetraacyldisaccharide 4'-kinase [Gemmatimonadota bacterium]
MVFVYTLLFTALTVLLSPVLACLSILDRYGMRQRLGQRPLVPDGENRPVVWFHCASVGEATGLAVVIGGFAERHPGIQVLVTTMTETGLVYVRKHVPRARYFGLAPLDAPFIVRRVFRQVRPRALVLLEGELWPGMLGTAAAHDCPVILVNGRMSDRSLARNRFVKPLFRHMLRRLAGVGVQHALDGERFITFGTDPGRVRVTGNVKFDLAAEQKGPGREALRLELGLSASEPVIMAGCPRPVEEERAVLAAFVRVRERYPEAKMIWAPRHLQRIPSAEQMMKAAGLRFTHRTRLGGVGGPDGEGGPYGTGDPDGAEAGGFDGPESTDPASVDVIILDTMGELAVMYAAADMAFVGATLVPLGGHNLLEPAACGIPVLFGPHTENVRASAVALLRTGGGMVVHGGDELARQWLELLDDPGKRARTGAAARQAVLECSRAVDRTLDLVDRWILEPDPGGSGGSGPRHYPQRTPFITRLMDPCERAPTIRFLRVALLPASLLMGMAVRLRNELYDRKLLTSDRLPVPVISIGALTAGGAGKTPVVRFLARRLRDAGYRPAVLSRGYGRNSRETRVVRTDTAWQEVGDEPAFLASMLPDVPVVVGPGRTAAGRLAIDQYGANVLLLDDGFQHRSTARAVDIVVHDATCRLGPEHNPERLLPAGPFREPVSSLRRAHALVLTRTNQSRSAAVDTARIKGEFPHLALVEAVYEPSGLRRLDAGQDDSLDNDTQLPPDWLAGREVLVLCGIANPASFVQTVTDAGGRVTHVLAYRDHHPFSPSDLDRALSLVEESGAECIVTTEKDAVRIPDHAVRKHLVALDIALLLTAGEPALEEILSTLDETR